MVQTYSPYWSVYSISRSRSFLDSFLAGMFTVPGDGMIDFTEPYRFLIEHGYDRWILVEAEQDPAIVNPHEYGAKARAYLESTLFTNYEIGRASCRERV